MSQPSLTDEEFRVCDLAAPGRGDVTAERLQEHISTAGKSFESLGVGFGNSVASLLPEGPDEATAKMALETFSASLVPLSRDLPRQEYISRLSEIHAKLLLMHPGVSPARDAALDLDIPIANVLRHFEAGVFTLEASCSPTPAPSKRSREVPLVLIASGLAYRRLSDRLDPDHPVIGITPPSLAHLPLPHTIEHIAAVCVRMLRRYRPHGPYALSGSRAEALVALEMARLLEEKGEKVTFVAMLDAADLFRPSMTGLARFFSSLVRRRFVPACEFLAEALRRYRPRPWYGKIIHLAPHGVKSHNTPSEMLAEPNVQVVARVLAAELEQ